MRDRVTIRRLRQWLLMAALALTVLPSCAPAAGPLNSTFDGDRAYADVKQIVGFGPREPGSPASASARAYIKQEVEKAGLTLQELPFTAQTPLGPRNMVNLLAEVKGTQPGIILLGNHYDTKFFRDFEFLGANDGGATTGWMIEIARALGPTREGRTVWLCWFDGEEAYQEWTATDSLYGSRQMVRWLDETGRHPEVHTMINVDMIGDCDLGVIRDAGAPAWLLDLVWGTAHDLKVKGFSSPIAQIIEDDHVPFRRARIPALNLIDFRYGGSQVEHQMNWHTPRDRVDLVCPDSLESVGTVMLEVLPRLDQALASGANGRE